MTHLIYSIFRPFEWAETPLQKAVLANLNNPRRTHEFYCWAHQSTLLTGLQEYDAPQLFHCPSNTVRNLKDDLPPKDVQRATDIALNMLLCMRLGVSDTLRPHINALFAHDSAEAEILVSLWTLAGELLTSVSGDLAYICPSMFGLPKPNFMISAEIATERLLIPSAAKMHTPTNTMSNMTRSLKENAHVLNQRNSATVQIREHSNKGPIVYRAKRRIEALKSWWTAGFSDLSLNTKHPVCRKEIEDWLRPEEILIDTIAAVIDPENKPSPKTAHITALRQDTIAYSIAAMNVLIGSGLFGAPWRDLLKTETQTGPLIDRIWHCVYNEIFPKGRKITSMRQFREVGPELRWQRCLRDWDTEKSSRVTAAESVAKGSRLFPLDSKGTLIVGFAPYNGLIKCGHPYETGLGETTSLEHSAARGVVQNSFGMRAAQMFRYIEPDMVLKHSDEQNVTRVRNALRMRKRTQDLSVCTEPMYTWIKRRKK